MTLVFRVVGKYYNTLNIRDIERYINGDTVSHITKYSRHRVKCISMEVWYPDINKHSTRWTQAEIRKCLGIVPRRGDGRVFLLGQSPCLFGYGRAAPASRDSPLGEETQSDGQTQREWTPALDIAPREALLKIQFSKVEIFKV